MEIVERFAVLLYNRASTNNRVNEVHQQLFAQKVRDLDVIHVLPAQATLLQHTKRAAYKQAIAGDKHASLIHSFPVHARSWG